MFTEYRELILNTMCRMQESRASGMTGVPACICLRLNKSL